MGDEPEFTVTDGRYVTMRKHKVVTWAPQPDITAYELASLIPLILAMTRDPMTYWEDYIPAEARRHFKISDQ